MAETRRWATRAARALLALALAAGLLGREPAQNAAQTAPLFFDDFGYADGLITNEDAGSPRSAIWTLTSGSLFASSGRGWTGVPDDRAPGAASTTGTNSAVFRMITQRSDFRSVAVSFNLLNQGLGSTSSTPPVAWDGCHILLRYQSEYYLYYASINRRDNTVIIKKKVPGGPSNGGTYYNLSAPAPYAAPYASWQRIKAAINTNDDGSVTINLYVNDQILVSATDRGQAGGAPIRSAGRVGVRGDNADLMFDDFEVSGLSEDVAAPPFAAPDADVKAQEKFLSPGLADGVNDQAFFGPQAEEVTIYSLRGRLIFRRVKSGGISIVWNCRDADGRPVESGVYIARIRRSGGGYAHQTFAVAR